MDSRDSDTKTQTREETPCVYRREHRYEHAKGQVFSHLSQSTALSTATCYPCSPSRRRPATINHKSQTHVKLHHVHISICSIHDDKFYIHGYVSPRTCGWYYPGGRHVEARGSDFAAHNNIGAVLDENKDATKRQYEARKCMQLTKVNRPCRGPGQRLYIARHDWHLFC